MQLLISCPNCNTSYQISDDQLQESDGQARCFHCQTVFNAALNSQPVSEAAGTTSPGIPEDDLVFDEKVFEKTPDSEYSDRVDDLGESDLSSLFNADRDSEVLSGPDDERLADSSMLVAEELLNIESDSITPLQPAPPPETSEKPASALGTGLWLAASLLLLAALVAQAGWHYRHTLLLNPEARLAFESICKSLPCKLPPRRDPEQFEVVDRTVSIHPEVNDILSIQMLFTNTADFAQPVPGVTLSLFNNQQDIIARRSFSFEDFIKTEESQPPLLTAGQTQQFFLNLEDPGPDVTGFEFSFY